MTGRAIYNIDYTLILQRPRLQYTTVLYSYETKHMSVQTESKKPSCTADHLGLHMAVFFFFLFSFFFFQNGINQSPA
ncbi:hypothetical protein ACN38_g1634 [Penicillium nordicum]|uniref:Uncharacterized protein n=1 Tax=Penicillium nordicum TaxID=229535 RepID=A0A0M8P8L9_9EURO|nr:hypothetical protein ACN38_g1634 [Penicillium nordicum]